MAKKWKGKWKDTKKPTARKPAPKSKKPAAKAKKKAPARAAPRPPFTDSDLTDKDGVKIREFAAYYAENPNNEQEPLECYALPPGCRTLTGFIRIRCDNLDDYPTQVKADTLWPRYVNIPVGTEVEVRGLLRRRCHYKVIDSSEENETFTVGLPGRPRSEDEVVGMHDVRRRPRKTTARGPGRARPCRRRARRRGRPWRTTRAP